MSERVIRLRFTCQQSPYQWHVDSDDVPNVAGLGVSMQSALQSWIEALPPTLMNQRSRIEQIEQQLNDARRSR
jgi:hypothetical protein